MDGGSVPARAAGPSPFGIACAAALVGGAMLCLWLPAFAPPIVAAAILTGGLWLWWRGGPMRPLGAGLAGFGLCALHALSALSQQLPVAHERGDFRVSGTVVDLPLHEERRTRFEFRIDGDNAQPPFLRGKRVRLSWYDGWDGEDPRRYDIAPGSRWRVDLRLRAPRGLRNPGWFDSEKHALGNRLVATGYLRHTAQAEQLAGPGGIDGWRDRIAQRIDAEVASESSRYVRALALGDVRSLAESDWEALRATGLTHLIAISGFHVGLVAGFFALAVAGLWWLLPWLGRWLPRPQAAAIGALAASIGYAAVAGFALPTVRTVLMIAVVVLARLLRRRVGVAESLALAAVAIVLVDPLSVLGAGFWLSFGGVAWLVWCLPQAREEPLLRGFLAAQWVVTLGLLPLTAILFGQASLAGPLANLVAIPWWSLVVVPLALIGTGLEALHAGWGSGAWRAAAWCFDLAWPLFGWLASSRFALWWLPEAGWFALPLALAGAFWLLLPRGVPGRPLAALCLLPLLWPDRGLPRHGEAEVVVLDVGQGLSLLVRTSGQTLLYDAGPAVPQGFDAGERVVVPSLQALGVGRLDAVVVSHGDSDHAGGLAAVQRRFAAPVLFAPQGSGVEAAAPCIGGIGWEVDGVRFRFLHPDVHFPYFGNEASCVLRVETRHGAVLLTGDIGEVIERNLVRTQADALRAEVVLAPHHGSGGSSDPALVAATGAEHVLVAAGHGNRFGHPDDAVRARWEAADARMWVTADAGALRVRLRGGGLEVDGWRSLRRRPWDAARRWQRLQ